MSANTIALRNVLSGSWGVQTVESTDLEVLKQALHARIKDMLSDDFETLVQLMYRIDVDETKFHQAMSLPGLDDKAHAITHLVISREIQRIEFRKLYSQGKF